MPAAAAQPKKIKTKKSKRINRSLPTTILLGAFLFLLGAFMALPLVYAVVSAFKPMEEFFLFPPRFFVQNPTTDNFVQMVQVMSSMWVPFERYLFNTVLISFGSTIVYVVIACMAAYPLAKHDFPGRGPINSVIVTALMFTAAVTCIARYIILAMMHMIDTYWAMFLPSLATTLGVFLCVQNLHSFPTEILESGKLDGAGEYRILAQLVIPNIKPVVATMIIFQFQSVWNINGSDLIYDEALKPLVTALSQITSAGISRAGAGSAASLILLIPPILVFVISQSNVMETMVNSGIKD
ncbi:MAG: carbohydrate ABC transporter permease [Clostridia bacterium]|nr:carbohydrate ABC transporter permease [Clostridia bacterium]